MIPHSGMGTGRQRAEAVAQGKASATAQMAAKNPHLELDLLILGTSDLQPSQLISSLHKWVFQEAGSGARVHG